VAGTVGALRIYLEIQTGRWPKYQSEIHFYSQFDGHEPEKTEVYLNLKVEEIAGLMIESSVEQ